MLTEDGPRVLEFNCRFGDPETQSVVPLLEGDLLELLAAAARGDVVGWTAGLGSGLRRDRRPRRGELSGGGRPGGTIDGVDAAEAAGALVFHAGTALHGDRLVTNGGRILAVTGRGASISDARKAAYGAAGRISFPGVRFRSDIAEAAAAGLVVELAREP